MTEIAGVELQDGILFVAMVWSFLAGWLFVLVQLLLPEDVYLAGFNIVLFAVMTYIAEDRLDLSEVFRLAADDLEKGLKGDSSP